MFCSEYAERVLQMNKEKGWNKKTELFMLSILTVRPMSFETWPLLSDCMALGLESFDECMKRSMGLCVTLVPKSHCAIDIRDPF
nr:hypothetical protein CFP56_12096 [Quercus suber]